MKGIGRIATFGFLGLLAATPAWAGARVDVGGGLAPAVSSASTKSFDGADESFDVSTVGSYALGAAWVLGDQVELGGRWQQSFFDEGTFDFGDRDQDLTLSSLTAGGRYQFFDRESLVRPYLAAQVGLALADAYSADDGLLSQKVTRVSTDETGFGLNAGGGLDFQITRFLSLGADVRYNYAGVVGDVSYLTTMFNVGLHLG